jgi:hypothetical protein
MDLQAMINGINEQQARDRGNYHLTLGGLIEALEANPDKEVDERFRGIGSWRGSYVEIAIFTDEDGLSVENEEYMGDYGDDYDKWQEENQITVQELPKNAGEMARLLRSILGKDFVGWKGGNFTIEEYKPLWITDTAGSSGNTAIIGIDDDLKFITKELRR